MCNKSKNIDFMLYTCRGVIYNIYLLMYIILKTLHLAYMHLPRYNPFRFACLCTSPNFMTNDVHEFKNMKYYTSSGCSLISKSLA